MNPLVSRQPPAAQVRRVMVRKVANVTKEAPKAKPEPPPQQIISKPFNQLKNEDILAFSIITKILLPKYRVEKINLLFRKLIEGKISFPTLSRNVSTHLEICPPLVKMWQVIASRESPSSNPLLYKLREVISWFQLIQASTSTIFLFISFLCDVKKQSLPTISVLKLILDNFDVLNQNRNSSARLLQLAVELLELLPKPKVPQLEIFLPQSPEIAPIQLFSPEIMKKPFYVIKQYSDVSTFLMRNGKIKDHVVHRHVSARDTAFTPSHHQHIIPIPHDGVANLYLNFYTKSLATGHEGGNRNHSQAHTDLPLPVIRDIHDVLEQPELVEHQTDAILSFNMNSQYCGHIIRTAGTSTYDEASWDQIESLLVSPEVREYVISKCQTRLPRLEEAHRDAFHLCHVFLDTRPINAYFHELLLPTNDSMFPFSFKHFDIESNVVQYCTDILREYTSPRFVGIQTFFRYVFPLIEIDSTSAMQLIAPMPFVACLFYFSKLCESIEPLLSRDPADYESIDAVYDIASEEIQKKFPDGESAVPYQFLTKTIKSICKNGLIIDSMAHDVERYFRSKSILISHIAPVLTKLNSACSSLFTDPHWEKYRDLAVLFSKAPTDEAEAVFASRSWLYLNSLQFNSQSSQYMIKTSPDNSQLIVTLMNV